MYCLTSPPRVSYRIVPSVSTPTITNNPVILESLKREYIVLGKHRRT